MIKNRKAMEKLVFDVFDKLDPSGRNTKKYKDMYSKMSNSEFENYVLDMLNDHRMFHVLDIETFKYEPSFENLDNAAKILGVEFFEYVAFPHMSKDPSKPIVTTRKVPVGYEFVKRLQQMKRKKNSTTTTIDQRDMKTNQATGHDKTTRISDMENYALNTYGADAALKEFMSFRADDPVMKAEAYSKISNDGYVSLKDLTDKPINKTALNALNTYLISMGLLSDLVSQGYILIDVLEDKRTGREKQ